MKIKWKFEEEKGDFDEYGNLKNYYKDSEPWKKQDRKLSIFLQVLLIILAMAVCGAVIVIGFSLGGYDWNQMPGIQVIREMINIHIR